MASTGSRPRSRATSATDRCGPSTVSKTKIHSYAAGRGSAPIARRSPRARGLDQAAPHLGVGQVLALLLERLGPELLPRREPVERQVGFEREDHAERAAVHLREHPPARDGGLLEQVEVDAPDLRRLPPAEQAPGHGASGLHGQVAQPHVVVAQSLGIACGATHLFAGELEDARVHVAHHAAEPTHLLPAGEAACDGSPVGRLVTRRS